MSQALKAALFLTPFLGVAASFTADRGVSSRVLRPANALFQRNDLSTAAGALNPAANGKASFNLYRCDNFEECRESVMTDTMEIVYRAAASDQVLLVWQERPRRVLLLTKPFAMAPELIHEVARAAALLFFEHGVEAVLLEADVHSALCDLITLQEEEDDRNQAAAEAEAAVVLVPADSSSSSSSGGGGSSARVEEEKEKRGVHAREGQGGSGVSGGGGSEAGRRGKRLVVLPPRACLQVWGRRLPPGVTPQPSVKNQNKNQNQNQEEGLARLTPPQRKRPQSVQGPSAGVEEARADKEAGAAEAAAENAAAEATNAETAAGKGVDLVVTLGGDGLLMHANTLFPQAAPPIVSLSGGSLGFLAPFEMSEMAAALKYALGERAVDSSIKTEALEASNGGVDAAGGSGGSGGSSQGLHLSLRMRLSCSFVSDPSEQERGQDATAAASSASLSASLYDDKKGGGGDTSAVAAAAAAEEAAAEEAAAEEAGEGAGRGEGANAYVTVGEGDLSDSSSSSGRSSSSSSSSRWGGEEGGGDESVDETAFWRDEADEATSVVGLKGSKREGATADDATKELLPPSPHSSSSVSNPNGKQVGADSTTTTWTVLNEVVIERGPSPYLAALEVHVNGAYLTTLQADGVIVSTPTGSTAYSMSAGGSMVHPSVPCVLLTPICPHSLSCRPMVLPDSAELVCRNSHDARADAWVSFDGKHRKRLRKGQALRITMSTYPLPTVNKVDDTVDWFHGIASAFHFNERPLQRPLSPKNAPP